MKYHPLIVSVVLLIAFPFFFYKYVPLVPTFLFVLIPFLLAVFFLTALKKEKGMLFFVFLFPLLNSLPYFFGLYENIPQAPVALVLFLAFISGWCINMFVSGERFSLKQPLIVPMTMLSLLILLSGLITFFRYSGFFPFCSDSLYEFIVNVNGVTSGGAFMSIFFSAANYLAGFAVFLCFISLAKSEKWREKIFMVLAASVLIATGFAFFQRFFDLSAGNTPFWVNMKQLNSLFKDPNALAVFLSAVLPFFLGLTFFWNKAKRFFAASVVVLILVVFPFIGNRSGFLGTMVSLLIFIILMLVFYRKNQQRLFKQGIFSPPKILAAVIIMAGLSGLLFLTKGPSTLWNRLKGDFRAISAKSLITVSPERYFLWKEAVRMTKDYPLTGVGLGAYIIELPNYYKTDTKAYKGILEKFRRNDSAENYWLHISSELGLMGLFCVLWLFWLIFRRSIYLFRRSYAEEKDILIMIGAVSGLSALAVNYLFHSYIGSFEAKFIFWILGGLVFSLGKSEKIKPAENKIKVFGLVLILLFGGLHLWSATHSLSLGERAEKIGIKQDFGWYQKEKDQQGNTFRWSGEYGGLSFKLKEPDIGFFLLASHPDIKSNPVRVKVFIVKDFFKKITLIDEISLSRDSWQRYNLQVPYKSGSKVILLFKVSRTWNPQKTLGVPDRRNLGIAIKH